MPDAGPDLQPLADPEDRKLVTLARSVMARTRAAQAACLRDSDGRTYAAASVDLPSLRLTATAVTVAMAVSSGSRGVEAVAVLGLPPGEADLAAVRDVGGSGVPVHFVAPDGEPLDRLTT